MKKGNTFVIIILSCTIVALLLMSVYLTLYMMDDSNPLKRFLPSWGKEESSGQSEFSQEPVNALESARDTEAPSYPAHDFILVGDSRTVAMNEAMNYGKKDTCVYVAKEGEGYDWFSTDGAVLLDDAVNSNPQSTLVLNLGVNDLRNLAAYIDLYQQLIDKYRGTTIRIMSVNPVDESKEISVSNNDIENFNASMKEAFPDNYLDCYGYLSMSGFETVDGLHYTQSTTEKIHSYLIQELSEL